ncbi:MAG: hypothetical protein M3Z10_11610 [Gemmatimonadota bacterium]|nr:hypothetical protein [Gemmatimonadota bacterium]
MTAAALLRVAAVLAGLALLAVSGVLGYISVIALRRSEGVFMPAGYVALACLAGGVFLMRVAMRS